MTMLKTITSALLALSVLGGMATLANASNLGSAFGTQTNSQQEPSPN
jgi:hypothetical protein